MEVGEEVGLLKDSEDTDWLGEVGVRALGKYDSVETTRNQVERFSLKEEIATEEF